MFPSFRKRPTFETLINKQASCCNVAIVIPNKTSKHFLKVFKCCSAFTLEAFVKLEEIIVSTISTASIVLDFCTFKCLELADAFQLNFQISFAAISVQSVLLTMGIIVQQNHTLELQGYYVYIHNHACDHSWTRKTNCLPCILCQVRVH